MQPRYCVPHAPRTLLPLCCLQSAPRPANISYLEVALERRRVRVAGLENLLYCLLALFHSASNKQAAGHRSRAISTAPTCSPAQCLFCAKERAARRFTHSCSQDRILLIPDSRHQSVYLQASRTYLMLLCEGPISAIELVLPVAVATEACSSDLQWKKTDQPQLFRVETMITRLRARVVPAIAPLDLCPALVVCVHELVCERLVHVLLRDQMIVTEHDLRSVGSVVEAAIDLLAAKADLEEVALRLTPERLESCHHRSHLWAVEQRVVPHFLAFLAADFLLRGVGGSCTGGGGAHLYLIDGKSSQTRRRRS